MTKLKSTFSDYTQNIKSSHDYYGNATRVRDTVAVVEDYFSHYRAVYNVDNVPELVTYYLGTKPQKTTISFVDDVASSLNNKYFFIYSAPANKKHHVWFNVDNAGIDPAPIDSIGIEVQINENDSASVIKIATQLTIAGLFSEKFIATNVDMLSILVETAQGGDVDNTVDVSTGFGFVHEAGEQVVVKTVELEYDGSPFYPKYNGQVLKNYRFNISTGKFELFDAASSTDSVAVGGHPTRLTILDESDFLAADLDTAAYTEVISVTAAENMKIKQLKLKADTFGSFKLLVNGVVQDYYQTSIFDRNCTFSFSEDLVVTTSQVVSIEFLPDRIQIDEYNFFLRVEAYT